MIDISSDLLAEGASPDMVDVVDSIHVPDLDVSALGDCGPVSVSNSLENLDGTRKGWDKTQDARCDFSPHLRLVPRAGILFVSLWQKSLMGRKLIDIKADSNEVGHFAKEISPVISHVLGEHLRKGGWCICTSPKRRHTEKNFASLVSEQIGDMLRIPFYEDVAHCKSRHRVNAVFTMNNLPKETNIIVFDDFVTTGSTLRSMSNLLQQYKKNFIFFAGVNNVFGKENS